MSDFFYKSQDGLKLYIRCFGPEAGALLPVVCLPGLTRNSLDFSPLAEAIVDGKNGRRSVYCFDYRGRGRSEYDQKWQNYNVFIETNDVIDGLTALGIKRAIFIGTSRGGLISMSLRGLRPDCVAGVILNDIGPAIESKGLRRIRSYVGKVTLPNSWQEAADLLRLIHGAFFTALDESDWMFFAKANFVERGGRFEPNYDKNIMNTLKFINFIKPLPKLWSQFSALRGVPLMVIRGENSDLLSEKTVQKMQELMPQCQLYRVTGQGHAPLLNDRASIDAINQFIARAS